ncbi:DNA-3-methyladenine glycosylase I [Cohaesibacter marisflavi]|uniref:DNA-3-methyladenine glycosylase I n=1 Tax=Cohaesibacter marisflavi TaxID=655353 RepID=A0A1I4Z9Y2_9HYPH|nr:DNA-3-methyladenine glycosylase I [Cohaesibacter marisflavi]SFN46997.1 DNA-3-methyladenine glycosylase I [Cohaesibacter marisflavi]
MKSIAEITHIAADRHGGLQTVQSRLFHPKEPSDLALISNDRWLAGMTRCIFRAGLDWSLIDGKWQAYEAALNDFDLDFCRSLTDEDLTTIGSRTDIVGNKAKLHSIPQNAAFLTGLEQEHPSLGAYFSAFGAENFSTLLMLLKKNGSRLGYPTACYFLRFMGVDGFVLGKDVVARLIAEHVIETSPTSPKALQKVQDAFSAWRDERGYAFSEISGILALSIDA